MKTEASTLPRPEPEAARRVASLWIWRCGGRAGRWLPQALLEGLDRPAALIEPLAFEGEFKALAKAWRADVPREADEQRLRTGLAAVGSLVHTVDQGPEGLHAALADAAAQRTECQHLLLYVRDSACRLADLLASRPERPPIEGLLRREREGAGRLGRVHAALGRAGQPVHWLALDDLAAPGPAGASAWQALWSFLGRPPEDEKLVADWRHRLAAEFGELMAGLDARTRQLLDREALWMGSPAMAPAFLVPVERPAGEAALKWLRFDRLPAVLREGEPVRLSGVVVPSGELHPDRRLILRQGARRQRLAWDQPSPAVAARWAGDPAAAQARFKPVAVRVSRREPAALFHKPTEKAAAVPVGALAFEPAGREPVEGIFLSRWSIGYQPIPKAACTSIKELLFRAVTGAAFSPEVAEGANHVHRYFDLRTRDVSAADFRFVVVRDPIKRFLSAFGNRVLHHKELSRAYVEGLGLVPPLDLEGFVFDPDLAGFVERFASYRRIPTIDHHFRPISEFSAPLGAFDKVYPFEALGELVADLHKRMGVPMALPHSQRGGPKLQPKDLPPRVFDKLAELFAADYAMLEGLYSPGMLR